MRRGSRRSCARRDLLIAYPYTNTLSVLEITGAVLRQAMERSAAYFTRNDDGTLRVSDCFLEPKVEHYNYDYYMGVSYTYDISRPVGQRVAAMTVQRKARGGYRCVHHLPEQLPRQRHRRV